LKINTLRGFTPANPYAIVVGRVE